MVLSLVIMGSSADRSAGDVALPVAVGETIVDANGVPGTATAWYPRANGFIKGAVVVSETAGMLECMFHKNTDANWNFMYWTQLQTATHHTNMINRLNYPIFVGDQISARGDNAGAVLDALGLYVDMGKGGEVPTTENRPLPAGAILCHATVTATFLADGVAEGVVVFDDFTPVRDVMYRVVGLSVNSATGHLARLNYITGPNTDDYPGVPCVDTEAAGSQLNMMWYGDFGSFKGQTPPRVQAICSAADAALDVVFCLVPGGKA